MFCFLLSWRCVSNFPSCLFLSFTVSPQTIFNCYVNLYGSILLCKYQPPILPYFLCSFFFFLVVWEPWSTCVFWAKTEKYYISTSVRYISEFCLRNVNIWHRMKWNFRSFQRDLSGRDDHFAVVATWRENGVMCVCIYNIVFNGRMFVRLSCARKHKILASLRRVNTRRHDALLCFTCCTCSHSGWT